MPEKGRSRDLTEIVKNNILYHLCLRSNLDFELPNGSYNEVAVLCETTGEAVRKVWGIFKKQKKEGVKFINNECKRFDNTNAEVWALDDEMISQLESVNDSLEGEGNLDDFHRRFHDIYHPNEAGPCRTTLYNLLHEAGSTIKCSIACPLVTELQKKQRIEYVLNKLEPKQGGYTFEKEEVRIFVDEKWFYLLPALVKKRQVGKSKHLPQAVKSKRFIPKMMFLVAICEPIGECDGKIGIYPFIKWAKAKRDSKNRDAGDDVIEDVAVTKEEYSKVLHQVIKDAREKLPQGTKVVIQQDGARPHGMPYGKEMSTYLQAQWRSWYRVNKGYSLETQPPQSPDLNLCDLSFFWSLQKASTRQEGRQQDLEGMLKAVIAAFNNYEPEKLSRQCAYIHDIYRVILDQGGGTKYSLPHNGVRKRDAEGKVLTDFSCSKELFLKAKKHIDRLSRNIATNVYEEMNEEV